MTDSSAPAPISISVASSKGSVPGMTVFVAKETGIFAKHGLDVDLLDNLRGGAALMSAVSSGTAHVVAQSVSQAALAKQQGADLPIISSQTVGAPYLLVAGPDKADVPVSPEGADGWQETIRALKGATISGSGPGTPPDHILKGLYQDAGLSPTDYTIVNIQHGGPEVAAMKSGQIDAAFVDIGTALSLVNEAGGRVVMNLSKSGPDWLTTQAWSGFMSSADTLAKFPELAQRWKAAMDETREFFQNPENIKELHRIAVEVCDIPEANGLDEAITTFASMMRPSFTTEQVQTTIDFLVRSGQIKEEPVVKPADIIAPQALSS